MLNAPQVECKNLKNIVIPAGVKEIGSFAFAECSSLESIALNNGLKGIGAGAFAHCVRLAEINIPNTVTSIGGSAFWSCDKLSSIVIPDGVTIIEGCTFIYCENLASVTLPNGITSIGNDAFSCCDSLTSINIPNSVKYIGERAFQLCNFKSFTIPNSVTELGEGAFGGCYNLSEVIIGSGVTEIKSFAFGDCYKLSKVEFKGNITSIEEKAFWQCLGLIDFVIPNTVIEIGREAFWNCYNLKSIKLSDNLQSIGNQCFAYCYKLELLEIPNSIKVIGDSAFTWCSEFDTIHIGSNIEQIGSRGFQDCYNLKRVYVDAMTPPQVGAKLFNQTNPEVVVPCGSLEKYEKTDWKDYNIQYEPIMHDYDYILEDKSVGTIDARSNVCDPTVVVITFIPNSGYGFVRWSDGNKDNAREVNVGEEVTFTPEYAVVNSGKCGDDWLLTWEYEPETKTLTISGEGTLNSNYTYGAMAPKEMEHLIIEDGVTSLGDDAFYNCYTLTSVEIPNSVTHIGWNTFSYCSNVTSLEIPSSVVSIGGWAFYGWHGLTSVTIPNNVTDLGRSAFGYCRNLTEIIVAEDHPMYCSVDGVLYNKDQTEILGFPAGRGGSYTLPASVTRIGYGVFADCYDLTSLIIPNGVISIGEEAFVASNGLTTITLPNSVTTIEGYAFYYCAGLKSFTSEATTPPECGENAFYGVDKTIPLYVPAASVDEYKAAEGWKDFENIVPIQAEEIPVVSIEAVPTSYSVVLSWPAVVDAATYTIEIKKGSETICTLTFNEMGQLLNIAFAPSRNGNRHNNQPRMALQTLTGWQYAITGLEPNTEYSYIVTTTKTDHSEEVQSISFTTKQTPTGVEEVSGQKSEVRKLLRNGQLYILRNGEIFNARGARVE